MELSRHHSDSSRVLRRHWANLAGILITDGSYFLRGYHPDLLLGVLQFQIRTDSFQTPNREKLRPRLVLDRRDCDLTSSLYHP